MTKKFPKIAPGEWVAPMKKGYKLACCDCALVHTMEFSHIPSGRGRKIIFRAWRDNKATAALRRKHRITVRSAEVSDEK